MSNHTPEPWSLLEAGDSIKHQVPVSSDRTSILTIATEGAIAFGAVYSADDARRIVACVNACRGLSSDELEQHGLVSAVGTELLELEQQRDELLAALQRLISSDPHVEMFPTSELEICANNEALPPTLREQAASVIQARAVIAMVKGGAS